MLLLAIILLLTSLVIAGVAAYFSIIGLSLLFVGSGISIIIMGTALEVGKLVAVTTLHHLWNKLNFLLKTYLFAAAILLSIITSVGIYGFLGNGYNATSIKVNSYKQNIELNEKKIKTLTDENLKLENYKPEPSVIVSEKETTQTLYFDQQNNSILQRENRIQELRKSVDILRQKAAEEKQQAKVLLDSEITKELSQINLYNSRLQILDKEVQTWLDQGTGGLFRQNGLERARQVKESQQKERDDIDLQIKASQSNIEKLRTSYNNSIITVDNNLAQQIKSIDSSIEKNEKEITDIQNQIGANKTANDESNRKNLDIKRDEKNKLEEQIKKNKETINFNLKQLESLVEQNKLLLLKINETDVGTFKFFAKNFNLELDKTVNWFIILIIIVFDPLAVTLLLCFNYILSLRQKKEKAITVEPKLLPLEPTTTPIKIEQPQTPTPTPTLEDKKEVLFFTDSKDFPYVHEEGLKADNKGTGLAYKAYPKSD